MSNQIYVPEEALKSHKTFREWYDRVSSQLFREQIDNENRFNMEKLSRKERIELMERIMRYTNNTFFDSMELINYKSKNRKWDCRKTDITSTTCVIILSNFKITYKALGELIGLHHTTVIYYVKRHAAYCMSSDYRTKYLKLLTQLQYERIIPTTKDQGYQPQQLVSTLLSGLQPKIGTTDSRSNGDKKAAAYGDALVRLGIKR